VCSSDDWQFPTNKFPNAGWLGRVHRGTPWQTVYLKAADIWRTDKNRWVQWAGNPYGVTNFGQVSTAWLQPYTNWWNGTNLQDNSSVSSASDAAFCTPVSDRNLLDIFTTAFNDNASRGRLSINQSGLAAWSAVLAGVITLTNNVSDSELAVTAPFVTPRVGPSVVEPAGVYDPYSVAMPALVRIVNAINDTRRTNTVRGVFSHLGDILAVPELTVGDASQQKYVGTAPNGCWAGISPFINPGQAVPPNGSGHTYQQEYGINDATYERIPQQILGLLQCDAVPRFVIYSYGQALKPADRSKVNGGNYDGMITNYQITAEMASRAVVRVEGAPNAPRVIVENYNFLGPDQ
jgi:hypothetical protein